MWAHRILLTYRRGCRGRPMTIRVVAAAANT